MVALATLADVERVLGSAIVAAQDRTAVESMLTRASSDYRRIVGSQVSLVTGEVAELDSNGSPVLLLPHWPVQAVSSVVVDGTALPVEAYQWSRNGTLRRRPGWPCGYRSVVVTYDHGHSTIPSEIVSAIAEAVAARWSLTLAGRTVGIPDGGLATISDVLALVPEAVLDDADAPGRTLTRSDVLAWIMQASGLVAARLSWAALSMTPTLAQAARHVVASYAASYLEDARYPERAGIASTDYATSLRAQADRELDMLAATVSAPSASSEWALGHAAVATRLLRWACA